MTDKLSIYNGALNAIKARRLSTLTDDVEARYVLDDNWDRDFIDTVLEKGLWNFAMRTVKITSDPSYTDPLDSGWERFDRPDDCVRVAQIDTNGSFTNPDLSYQEEGNYIYSTQQTIYVRYVSNGASFGTDYSLWPPSFTRYAESFLGLLSIGRIADARTEKETVKQEVRAALFEARSRDAQKEPTKFAPMSSWNKARFGKQYGRSPKDYGGM